MTQDPNMRPNWMRGKQPPEEPPTENPPEDSAEDGDAELPPWLREDAPPPPPPEPQEPRVKRLKPPGEGDTGGLPPWLAGADEPPTPKTYKIGGAEFSEEFLSAAEELPDSDDSGMTFDSWMAERIESTREKDIEEEVPDDLLSSLEDDGEAPKSTGQLPDWFLGLEALDTTEAPDWFSAEDAPPPPASAAPPTWMNDLMEDDALPAMAGGAEEDELPSADEIGSFFNSIGAEDEEETPEIDWYDESGDDTVQTPGDDFFAQLVGGGGAASGYDEDAVYEPPSALDEFVARNDFDEEDADVPSAPGAVEIPQNELDAFFSGLASGRGEPASMDEIEDPELDWVVDEDAGEEAPAPYEPPEIADEQVEDSSNWLSELQNIVSGATRPLTPSQQDDDLGSPGATVMLDSFESDPDEPRAAVDEGFVWQDEDAVPVDEAFDEAAEEDAPDSDWLRSLSPADASDASEVNEDAPPSPPPSLRSRLTDRLNQQPELPATVDESASSWDEVMNAAMPGTDALFGEDAPENDVSFEDETADEGGFNSGALYGDDDGQLDDAFRSESLFGDDAQPDDALTSEAFTSEALFAGDVPENDEMDAAEDFFADLPEMQADDEDELFFGGETRFDAGDETEDEDVLPAAELNTGWLKADLLNEGEDEADDFAADADDFGMSESAASLNLFDEDYPDLFGEQGAAGDAEDDAPAWSAADLEMPQTGDLLGGLGAAEQETAAETAPDDYKSLYGGWEQDAREPDEAAAPDGADDFFAGLGADATDALFEAPLYGDDEQAEDDAPVRADDDFLAALGMDMPTDTLQEDAPADDAGTDAEWLYGDAAQAGDEDFVAELGMDAATAASETEASAEGEVPDWLQAAAPAEDDGGQRLPQTGEFLAGLGFDEDVPAEDEESDSWGWQGTDESGQRLPQTSEFLAGLSFEDDAATDDGTDALFAPTDAEERSDDSWLSEAEHDAESTTTEDEFFSVLDIGSDEGELAAEEPALFSDWQTDAAEAGEATDADDFFAALDSGSDDEAAAGLTGDDLPEPELFADELPASDDLFNQWLDEEPAVEDAGDASTQEDDFFAAMGMGEGTGAAQDAALRWETEGDVPPAEDFFAALGMIDEGDAEPPASPEADDELLMPDFFAAMDEARPVQVPAAPATGTETPFTDVDSYLASLSDEPTPELDRNPFEQDAEIDLDALFSEALETRDTAPLPGDALPGANEDWLLQMQASVDEVSASAMVRQQEDQPEELSDRLKKLRERAGEIPDEADDAGSGVVAAAALGTAGSLVHGVTLTPEQQARVELLKGIVPKEGRAQPFRMSAIDATYDSPFMPELEDTAETTVHPMRRARPERTRRRTRRRLNIRFDRFFVALALAAAVIAPFVVPGFRVGTLPPENFAANGDAQNAFNQVHSLQSGDLVLVAVEYGAASAGELDDATDALLRHILLRSAFPVVVSGNAVGLLRAETRLEAISEDEALLERIGADAPLQANEDYYVVRYLPGSVIGLRAFSQDTANLLLSDIRGQATALQVRSLNDFSLVAVITDRAEDLRGYAEQVAPLTRAPMLAAVSYSAAPLAEPYMQALEGGLLVGYADAYTYSGLIDTVAARDITERVRIVPTLEPTPTVEAAEATAEATPTPRPTRRAVTPTPQPTTAPDTATVNAEQAVNVRAGAGTNFPVLAAVQSGAVLEVLGYNDDQSWVNVLLEDGREGWISASLLTIQTSQSAAPKQTMYSKRQAVEEGEDEPTSTATATRTPTRRATATRMPTQTPTDEAAVTVEADATEESVLPTRRATATPRPTRTAQPSATPTEAPAVTETVEATAELTAEATEAATAIAAVFEPPPSPGYRDERWYAMNMGIIASALIITLGMVINLVRGLFRRGRRG